jgi:predicted transcriptional regulator of viral defense system
MVKWATAFSMEELTRSISAGKEEALKDIRILAQMNASEIDEVLAEALQKNRPVSIQLNQKDYLGRQTESIVGYFRGSLTGNKILINNQWISLESIRNIHFLQEQKWSQVHVFTNKQKQVGGDNPIPVSSVNFDTEEQDPLETDLTWIEDFNQSEEWIE